MPRGNPNFVKGHKKIGGKKKGSKHKTTIQKELVLEDIKRNVEQQIMGDMKTLVKVKMESAKGLYAEDKSGIVFQKDPDGKAGEYLIDRVLGKPKERVETEAINPVQQILLVVMQNKEVLVQPINANYVKDESNNDTPTKPRRQILTREDFEQGVEDKQSVLH